MEQQQVTIRNEEEAFAFIERALKHELKDVPLELKFVGWPVLEITLQGKGYDSTITAEMAHALVELQGAMNRSYARSVHHAHNARKLTVEERKNILFKAKIEKGSSLIKIDLGDYIETLSANLVNKMTPEDLVITVIGVAAVAGTTWAYKAFLKHRSEDKKGAEEAAKAIALSKEETRRMEIFADAVKVVPRLDFVRQDFDEARHEIVKGTADADSITVNDVKLDRETARVISMTKRSESKEVQLNGNYFIRKTDWQIDGEVRLTIAHVDTAKVITASFKDDSLDKEQTKIIEEAEWSRHYVYLSINATELRGDITTATIISVKAQPKKAGSA